MTASKIDWHFWLGMREIKAWQAISLSLGVDPKYIRPDPDNWKDWPEKAFSSHDNGFPNNRIKEEFGKRLRLLQGSISDRSHFKAGSLSMESPAYHGVKLDQVAKWLKSIRRTPLAADLLRAIESTTELTSAPSIAASHGSMPANESAAAKPRQQYQEEEILRIIAELGFSAKALRKPTPGKKGSKAAVRAKLSFSPDVFDKAWERLRKAGRIQDIHP